MPSRTLCAAMRRERRAMASATLSSRSRVITTSAASEDAEVPHAPRAAPTYAPTVSATSRRSPVTMTTREMPERCSCATIRAASGRTGSATTRAPAAVSSTATNTSRDPSSAERRRSRRIQSGCSSVTNRWCPPAPWCPHDPADPLRGDLLGVAGQHSVQAPLAGGPDHRSGDVWGHLVQGRGQPQQSLGGDPGRGHDVPDRGAPGGQRAGLVEQQYPSRLSTSRTAPSRIRSRVERCVEICPRRTGPTLDRHRSTSPPAGRRARHPASRPCPRSATRSRLATPCNASVSACSPRPPATGPHFSASPGSS